MTKEGTLGGSIQPEFDERAGPVPHEAQRRGCQRSEQQARYSQGQQCVAALGQGLVQDSPDAERPCQRQDLQADTNHYDLGQGFPLIQCRSGHPGKQGCAFR